MLNTSLDIPVTYRRHLSSEAYMIYNQKKTYSSRTAGIFGMNLKVPTNEQETRAGAEYEFMLGTVRLNK